VIVDTLESKHSDGGVSPFFFLILRYRPISVCFSLFDPLRLVIFVPPYTYLLVLHAATYIRRATWTT